MKTLTHLSRPLAIAALALAATFGATASAQTDTASGHQSIHGLTQAQVIARFGEPEKRHAPVPARGEHPTPPITRWDYPDFSVYFEKTIALHRVDHGKFRQQ